MPSQKLFLKVPWPATKCEPDESGFPQAGNHPRAELLIGEAWYSSLLGSLERDAQQQPLSAFRLIQRDIFVLVPSIDCLACSPVGKPELSRSGM